MPLSRFDRLSPERKDTILSAAADEFSEHGYAAASMNRMIERAGSSKGVVYYYFENKADLLDTVVNEAQQWVMKKVEWPRMDALSADTYWRRLFDMGRTSMQLLHQDTWQMRILRSLHRLREEPAAREATSRLGDRGRQIITEFLRRGRELGMVRDDLPLELLVEMYVGADAAGDRWMLGRWEDLTEQQRSDIFTARFDLVHDMLTSGHERTHHAAEAP